MRPTLNDPFREVVGLGGVRMKIQWCLYGQSFGDRYVGVVNLWRWEDREVLLYIKLFIHIKQTKHTYLSNPAEYLNLGIKEMEGYSNDIFLNMTVKV